MSQSWRLKTYLTLFFVFLSLYFLVPTFLGFNTIREEKDKKGESVPWYITLFPQKNLNLGLDLRGGIYLELEVSLKEAIHNRIDLISGSLNRFTKEEKLEVSIDRLPGSALLRIRSNNTQSIEKVQKKIDQDYPSTFQVSDEKTSEIAESQLQSPFSHQTVLKLTESRLQSLQKEMVEQSVEKIRSRIDRYGVSEPSIRQLGDNRVAVELPGVKDPERAITLVKRSGRLEFKLVDDSKSREEVEQLVAEIRQKNQIPEGATEEIVQKINQLAIGQIPAESEILFETEKDPVTKKTAKILSHLVKRKVEITGEMLQDARSDTSPDQGPHVSLSLNPAGTEIFAELTKANVGKLFAIILDGNVISAPVIRQPIPSGNAVITSGRGDYDDQNREAQDLALVLREGALPATLKEVTKSVIGPSLGKATIRGGLIATGLAAASVILFMLFYYKKAGIIANIALGLNVLFIVGLLALFQATLTLPGIAGIVLTMGMALDGSVIIFERIREELKEGKNVRNAVETGFKNAFSAVVDTHLTTFLSGIVLYKFGTGPVRGFAVTLMVGVITTLFTAYLVSKLMFDYLVQKTKIQKLSI